MPCAEHKIELTDHPHENTFIWLISDSTASPTYTTILKFVFVKATANLYIAKQVGKNIWQGIRWCRYCRHVHPCTNTLTEYTLQRGTEFCQSLAGRKYLLGTALRKLTAHLRREHVHKRDDLHKAEQEKCRKAMGWQKSKPCFTGEGIREDSGIKWAFSMWWRAMLNFKSLKWNWLICFQT